jgi:hypothetical protein
MAYEVNAHVVRLNGYLPFDADFNSLFQEYVDPERHVSLPTRARDFLADALSSPKLRMIVLTGDAGHGKTHLCAKLLEYVGFNPADAKVALEERCDGVNVLATTSSGAALKIIKDLSEYPVDDVAPRLADALESHDELLVVCANEGRLRSAISAANGKLDSVRDSLRQGLATGRLDVDSRVLVLNLNLQSVAAAETSLVEQLLQKWVVHQRMWNVCGKCDARDACPILENRRQLSDGERGIRRRRAMAALLRSAERIGAVITIRELLILAAYAITGGLQCKQVHQRARRMDWQHAYLFSENIFGDRLSPTHRQLVRSLREIRLLDPGQVALRGVDDALVPDVDDAVGRFAPREMSATQAAPTTRAQARSAAERERTAFRFLRRRDYFVQQHGDASLLERLGFRHGGEFERVASGDTDPAAFRSLRDLLVAGLEAVQGLRRGGQRADLVLVDPAFASGATTSIVARRISTSRLHVRSQSASWRRALDRDPDAPDSLDWIERTVVFEITDDGAVFPVELDLLRFEYVLRAGEGLDARSFFEAEARRIGAELAPLAQKVQDDDQIVVLREGRLERLLIDVGETIRGVVE